MAKAKGDFLIPFDSDGNLLSHVTYYNKSQAIMKQNYKFQDELVYEDYSSTAGGASMHFKSLIDGRSYHMNLKDFHECMIRNLICQNIIKGEFTFSKTGTRFRMTPVLPKIKKD